MNYVYYILDIPLISKSMGVRIKITYFLVVSILSSPFLYFNDINSYILTSFFSVESYILTLNIEHLIFTMPQMK
ncbi:unnamed protein product [Trifolium pratense]|uniref:Uncharacterized protein n=1 Tax=Trifolium pratense TaxID=57577 RepID=A0ACB0IUF0_TRIPR|nr:unnamed protein product [Trifolium pratense]